MGKIHFCFDWTLIKIVRPKLESRGHPALSRLQDKRQICRNRFLIQQSHPSIVYLLRLPSTSAGRVGWTETLPGDIKSDLIDHGLIELPLDVTSPPRGVKSLKIQDR